MLAATCITFFKMPIGSARIMFLKCPLLLVLFFRPFFFPAIPNGYHEKIKKNKNHVQSLLFMHSKIVGCRLY
jgi:hypothetical protein